MSEYTIVKCIGCGRLFRIASMQVYKGDTRYCSKCNKDSGEGSGEWQSK